MKTNDKNEKKIALLAKNKLSKKIMSEIIYLRNVGTDKYGRVLANVILNGRDMSKWLIKKRLAVEYDGGTKKTPKNWYAWHRY